MGRPAGRPADSLPVRGGKESNRAGRRAGGPAGPGWVEEVHSPAAFLRPTARPLLSFYGFSLGYYNMMERKVKEEREGREHNFPIGSVSLSLSRWL